MSTCLTPACGLPRTRPGQPPKGWVQAHAIGQPHSWYCTPECAYTGLTGQPAPQERPAPEPEPIADRPDVAHCPLCINRHDRNHRCGVCNTTPQLVRHAPPPERLYDKSRRDIPA